MWMRVRSHERISLQNRLLGSEAHSVRALIFRAPSEPAVEITFARIERSTKGQRRSHVPLAPLTDCPSFADDVRDE
ncbi:hypothetical protein ACLOJK_013460 [Asimina triloba]